MITTVKSIKKKLKPQEIKLVTTRSGEKKIVFIGDIHQINPKKIRGQMG